MVKNGHSDGQVPLIGLQMHEYGSTEIMLSKEVDHAQKLAIEH